MGALRTLLVLAALLMPATAGAVTMADIIELTRAGLPDDVLVAVIDADRTVFTLDKGQILELKKAGVSRAVLLKMLRSRREFEPQPEVAPVPAPAAAPVTTTTAADVQQPGLVIIGGEKEPPPATVVVPQYYVVPFPIWGFPPRHGHLPAPQPFISPENRGFGRFINDGWIGKR